MRTLSAFVFALMLATGGAMAQGTGGSGGQGGGGGTESGSSGMNTGKSAGTSNPTAAQCAKGWDSTMTMTQAEFNMKCEKK